MALNVYANGREIAGKSSDGKAIAAFPDVCLSPPPSPAGPIPVPYPNTAFAKDTTGGSKTVTLHGKEAMLKNTSYFKTSTGDEPATKGLGGGVVTHQIMGKVYFTSWSMNVFIEGENVVRHLDLTTHNHGSVPGNTPTWPYIARPAASEVTGPCEKDAKREKDDCADYKPHKKDGKDVCDVVGANTGKSDLSSEQAERMEKQISGKSKPAAVSDAEYQQGSKCMKARRCQLAAIEPTGNQGRCCPSQTAHHMIPASAVFDQGRGGTAKKGDGTLTSIPLQGIEGYNQGKAPCVCVEGTNQNHASHGRMHTFTSYLADRTAGPSEWIDLDQPTIAAIRKMEREIQPEDRGNLPIRKNGNSCQLETRTLNYKQARDQAVESFQTAFGEHCDSDCLKAQLDAYHKDECKIDDKTKIKTVVEGRCKPADVKKAGGQKLIDKYGHPGESK